METRKQTKRVMERPVPVDAGDAVLAADLAVPDEAAGIVVFAHGSGSGRHSRRNRQVASVLQERRSGHASARSADRTGRGRRPA